MLIAVIAGLLAAAEVVWVLTYIDRSSDGSAFVMALVVTVVLPTLLAAIPASLIVAAPRWTRIVATGAVAAAGLAAAGVEAGVFVADAPADPAFIQWVAAVPLFALVVAMLLIGRVGWVLLAPLPSVWRVLLTVITGVVLPVVIAVVILTGMPLVVLIALASPVVLLTVAAVVGRRQRREAAI